MTLDVIDIARVAHEANRAFCRALGDNSQPPWDEAPLWQKDSAIKGVLLHVHHPDTDASASHEAWLAEKQSTGWVYGEVKDPVLMTHPCVRPFDELPIEQQRKDHLFKAIVHALAPLLAETVAETPRVF